MKHPCNTSGGISFRVVIRYADGSLENIQRPRHGMRLAFWEHIVDEPQARYHQEKRVIRRRGMKTRVSRGRARTTDFPRVAISFPAPREQDDRFVAAGLLSVAGMMVGGLASFIVPFWLTIPAGLLGGITGGILAALIQVAGSESTEIKLPSEWQLKQWWQFPMDRSAQFQCVPAIASWRELTTTPEALTRSSVHHRPHMDMERLEPFPENGNERFKDETDIPTQACGADVGHIVPDLPIDAVS